MDPSREEMTRLGNWGLAPIALGAALLWLAPFVVPQWIALNFQTIAMAYAGVIVAWLAGAGAGAMLTKEGPRDSFLPGMIAALVAWFAIWPGGFLTFSVPAVYRYLLLIGVFAWLYVRDQAFVQRGFWPAWYGELRQRLSLWMIVGLVLIMSRMIMWGYF
jgi:hypothetical protein